MTGTLSRNLTVRSNSARTAIDETLVPKGKDHPEEGPYVPEHDGVDPDTSPDATSDHPTGKSDLGA